MDEYQTSIMHQSKQAMLKGLSKKMTRNEVRTCGILVHYLYGLLGKLKQAIVDSKPTANQREFKMLNRIIDNMIREHQMDISYKLDEWHRRDIISGEKMFVENISMTQTQLYFQIRNEVINTNIPESCHEPVIMIRMVEMMITIIDKISMTKGLQLARGFVLLLDVLKAFCTQWEDKGNQQDLCKRVIMMEVERMINEE